MTSSSIERMRHSSAALAALLALFAFPVSATDVALAGLLPGRAIVVIDGGSPRTLAVGGKAGDVRLLAVESGAAVFEIGGKKERLELGAHAISSGRWGGDAATVTLMADGRGQFFAQGSVNGAPVRFMVDTGATYVSLSAGDAVRAGIDYRGRGQPGRSSTANGIIRVWHVPGNTVRLGDITLHGVDVSVNETNMPLVLLGMSFLNRVEMKREGDTMTLKKRF